jgi:hypothetical protein
MHIPQTGLSKQEILATLQAFKSRDMDWKGRESLLLRL